MGLFDLFKKDGRDERARDKNIKRATNKFSQSADRMKALQALREDGSDEAIYGLLKRFGVMYDKTIEDEQEKDWVFETLVEKGASTIPAVQRYLFSAESISWPLRVLDKVADKEKELDVLRSVLERHEPGYERDPTKKIQLLNHLGGIRDARVSAMLIPYLGDMDEGVRYAAVEALIMNGNEEAAREPLLQQFVSENEDSRRIRIRIADGLAEKGWLVKGHRGEVEKHLPELFVIDREGHIKRRPDASRKDE